jgi:hypothetical protein
LPLNDDLLFGMGSLDLVCHIGDQQHLRSDQVDGVEIFKDDHAILPPQGNVRDSLIRSFGEKFAHFAPKMANLPVVRVAEGLSDVLEQVFVKDIAQRLPFVRIPLGTSFASFGL